MRILIINGPNLNLLGEREPEIYGKDTLADINTRLQSRFPDVRFTFFQSNHEGAIIDAIHQARKDQDGIVMNPGAYTHTSIAIRDAVASIKIPVIEVHLSNVFAREEFRKHSFLTPVCGGLICGFGAEGYSLAVQGLIRRME
jgi:3-dehydroquinate dehydratase II